MGKNSLNLHDSRGRIETLTEGEDLGLVELNNELSGVEITCVWSKSAQDPVVYQYVSNCKYLV